VPDPTRGHYRKPAPIRSGLLEVHIAHNALYDRRPSASAVHKTTTYSYEGVFAHNPRPGMASPELTSIDIAPAQILQDGGSSSPDAPVAQVHPRNTIGPTRAMRMLIACNSLAVTEPVTAQRG
jgi:hypothetical protein